MLDPVGIALVGYGYWGKNLARNTQASPATELVGIVEVENSKRRAAHSAYPHAQAWTSLEDALAEETVEGLVIATQASSHFELAIQALRAGRHVLIEKPIAKSVADSEALVSEAQARDLVLMVGHTFLYSSRVEMLKRWISAGELGQVQYIHSKRLSLGRIRSDCNALWNFAPHDLSIMMHLLDERPVEVSARGFAFVQPDIEDVCFASLTFPSGVGANLHVSWIDPLKTRTTTVVGDRKMAVYDDVSVDRPLHLIDSGVAVDQAYGDFLTFGEFQWTVRAGDITIPRVDMVEPLLKELTHFGECCRTGSQPISDGQNGLDVVRVLVALDESMRQRGMPVGLGW